jgi:ATP-dependent DNA helicase RecQ
MNTSHTAALQAAALDILQTRFGYDAFRPGQLELISALFAGQDCLGIMPTGAGKSVCYQVPACVLPGCALVISPLVALMADQVANCLQVGVRAAYVNSSLGAAEQSRVLTAAASGAYDVLYVAPERLRDPRFIDFARTAQISFVAVDEAHCVSQWGQSFRAAYLDIAAFLHAFTPNALGALGPEGPEGS